jgi:hypothetical protein
MAKFCANGHQMEDSWELCPYCQKTGFQKVGSASASKTRLESEPPKDPLVSVGSARRTVLLADKRKPPVVGWLVAITGEQRGEDFRLREGKNLLGSGIEAQVVIRDPAVSSQHASLRYEDSKFYLTDLDSSNGTFVNDTKIARHELKDNDVVRLGEVTLKFKCL